MKRKCLWGCGEEVKRGKRFEGFCCDEHNLLYCQRALDYKLARGSPLPSAMASILEMKSVEIAKRKLWRKTHPGLQPRYKKEVQLSGKIEA